MNASLNYVFDPLCGWCYGAGPLLREIADRYQNKLSIELLPGLLFEQPREISPTYREHILIADQQIGSLAGVRFGPSYLSRILYAEQLVYDSSAPSAAVLAVAEIAPHAALSMLESIQQMHYVNGGDVCNPQLLNAMALGVGVCAESFQLACKRILPTLSARAESARALMSAVGSEGFPSLILRFGDRHIRLDHRNGYADPSQIINRIDQLFSEGLRQT